MIIDVWMPLRKGSGKSKKVIKYKLVDTDIFLKEKKKGYIVRYKCDKCLSNNIQNTTSGTLFRDFVVYNTLEFQTCRSCRSRISEYEIKKTQIDFNIIKKSIEDNNYQLLSTREEYDTSFKKSQMKFKCVCPNGHEYYPTWNNWNKGKRCRKCYEIDKYKNAVRHKDGYELYYFLVLSLTEKVYGLYKNEINPENKLRGNRQYHLDHKFSKSQGFRQNIPPYIIASKFNLELIKESKNCSKMDSCSISIDDLCDKLFTAT